jgi:hypothetical protein
MALMQSRVMSLAEAITNVVVGYSIAVATQIIVFPLLGLNASINDNLIIGAVFTTVSLARSYAVRRLFERWGVLPEARRATEFHRRFSDARDG